MIPHQRASWLTDPRANCVFPRTELLRMLGRTFWALILPAPVFLTFCQVSPEFYHIS